MHLILLVVNNNQRLGNELRHAVVQKRIDIEPPALATQGVGDEHIRYLKAPTLFAVYFILNKIHFLFLKNMYN